jgi:hypothetical protein
VSTNREKKRPSFFIVGHSKSGTTALSIFLDQHPELFVCDPEEPNYFCPSWCRAPGPPSLFFPRSEAEYLSLFDRAQPGQRCGEASAAYLYSTEAAELIHRFDPEARIIMIFREPVSFLRSFHLQMLTNTPEEGETVRDLGEAIELESERRAGRKLPQGCLGPELLYYASDRIRYDEQFERFARRFPREQILPLVYDDFRADNAGTVRRVYELLEVDPEFEPELGDHNTGGQALRSRRLASLLHHATHSRTAALPRRAVPRQLRRRAIDAAYSVAFEQAGEVDPVVAETIRARAFPHVEALGELLGRDLVGQWGYSRSASAVGEAVG